MMEHQKRQTPLAGGASQNQNTQTTAPIVSASAADAKSLKGRSTQTEAQIRRIVAALRTGPKTTDDLRKLGVYQTSARIWGLRARGYNIVTDLFDGYAADGYSHARMARYTLVNEPGEVLQ
ncbi:MAG: hypothetical protein EOO27_00915 [Comamonadaceae bacterium]|nr:MAG: hypothetical protein EOO27_00915 [Comamonadaceae bacterium]